MAIEPIPPMTEEEQLKHNDIMQELMQTWYHNNDRHTNQRLNYEGIRSSQISALIAYLIKKGIL